MTDNETLISELTTKYLTDIDASDTEEAKDWAEGLVEEINESIEQTGLNPDSVPIEKKRALAFNLVKLMDDMVEKMSEDISQLLNESE